MRSLFILTLLMVVCLGVFANQSFATESSDTASVLPRKIIAIYDSKYSGDPRFTRIHRFLEMPLNHLGFIVDYHDIQKPLPEIGEDVQGVLVWFLSNTIIEDPKFLLSWLHGALDKGKKLLVMGGLGESEKFRQTDDNIKEINRLMHRIGVHDRDAWVNVVHNVTITQSTPALTNFERRFEGEIQPYSSSVLANSNAISHLQLKAPDYEEPYSDLIITNENGGYVAEGYGVFQLYDEEDELVLSQWFINPFKFLKLVFKDSYLPKPDPTTLLGRRIFYSHLDGDGWNNLSEVSKYKDKRVLSSKVLYEEVFKTYADFPFTVGVIVDELRPDCYGVPDSIPTARAIYALDNIEAGSHTYSHPLYWGYFADGDAQKELAYQDLYPKKPNQRFFLSDLLLSKQQSSVETRDDYDKVVQNNPSIAMRGIRDPSSDAADIMELYRTPRSYACDPFNLNQEIQGSVDYIEQISSGKKVKIMQWSGNTTPFEAAIRKTRQAGLTNINGGDSRFDTEYPSYATVSPISAPIGKERQIYSSNSNENTYTNLWTDRFFGFKYLQTTVNNTENPIRVAPYNLYFHTYSGEKEAALTAVKENLEFARKQKLHPIFASEYASIADSFFTVQFIKLGNDAWRVLNRGTLQTIRIDDATLKSVDFEQSKGVIGQNYYQGSLYIALDDSVNEPEIRLKEVEKLEFVNHTSRPYIIESNWKIRGLQFGKESLIFTTTGYGGANISIQMPDASNVKIKLYDGEKLYEERLGKVDVYNRLKLAIVSRKTPVGVFITVDKK